MNNNTTESGDLTASQEATSETPRKKASKKSTRRRRTKKKAPRKRARTNVAQAAYPRHTIDKCIRIPRAIVEQNAGKECTESEAADFVGIGKGGPLRLEISSCIKFNLLERPSPGRVLPTDLAKKIIRPQNPEEELKSFRESVINAPSISDVYNHYRGENLPDEVFFKNALMDKFGIPEDKLSEFIEIFLSSLATAKLIEEREGKRRILDITEEVSTRTGADQRRRAIGKDVSISSADTCFVMMPFASPVGDYYSKIYEPAVRKAGLTPVRADTEIFGTRKS